MNLKVLMLSLLSLPVLAQPVCNANLFPWVATLSFGPVWATSNVQQTINLTPTIKKTYTTNITNSTLADGELFLGVNEDLTYDLFAHIGIALALTSKLGFSGNIWDDANSKFNNYVYGYDVQHGYVAIKAKLFKDLSYSVLPWISGSVGVGFNRANGFYNEAVIYEAIPQNNFSSYTQADLAYTAGLGLQKIFNLNWQAGIGYEFSSWGQSRLNPAPGQTIGYGLSLNHIYTNGLMFNLTYTA